MSLEKAVPVTVITPTIHWAVSATRTANKFFEIMTKTVKIAMITAAALSLVACTKEIEKEIVSEGKEVQLTFSSEKPNLTDAETRTAWDGSTIVWTKGDAIRIAYTVNGNWQTATGNGSPAKMYASDQLKDSEAGEVAHFKVSTEFTDADNASLVNPEYKFYGIYPSAVGTANFTNAPSLSVAFPTEQTPEADSFDKSADIMYATSSEYNGIPTDRVVDLTWNRIVAHADISMRNLQVGSGETLESITITAQAGADLSGNHNLNITNGEITLPGSSTGVNKVVIKPTNLTLTDGAVEFWATTLPFTATELTFTVKTNLYTYVRTFTGINLQFLGNARNTLNVNMKLAQKFQDYTEDFTSGIGEFTTSGTEGIWNAGNYNGTYYMKGTSRISNANTDGEGWLISPFLSINSSDSELSFGQSINGYFKNSSNVSTLSTEATVWAREKGGEWQQITITYPAAPSSGFTDFEPTSVSLSSFNGRTIQIGFKYIGYANSANGGCGTWEISNFKVSNSEIVYYPSFEFTSATTANVSFGATTVVFAYSAAHLTSDPTVAIKAGSDDIIDGTPTIANGKVTVNVKANSEEVEKTAILVVTCEGVDNIPELIINQEAKSNLVETEATIDFTTKGYTNAQVVTEVVQEPFTVSLTKGGNNDPKYYTTSGGSLRFYNGGTMTVSSEYTITKIVLTGTVDASVDGVAVSNKTWTGASNAVVFTATATNQIKALTITYLVPGSDVPATYSVSIASGIQNGSVTASKTSGIAENESITLTVSPNSGYELESLTVDGANVTSSVADNKYTFNMPGHDVSVSASFKSSGSVTPDEETTVEVTMTSQTATEGVITFVSNGLTFTFDKRNGSTAPTWNANSSQLRLYAKGSLTVSGKTITKIVYSYVVNKSNAGKAPSINSVSGTNDAGSWDDETTTWTSSTGDNSVVMDLGGDAGNFGFTKITVTYK